MNQYIPIIGLEIHAELKTQTKMFCNSPNDPDETEPNVNVCPVCLAHPGTLPVINREAVKYVLKVGAALGGSLADYTEFARKSYFYPDLPKGYQISQYEFPLVSGGTLNGVRITRVHLEEDTASSVHDEERGTTVIDFNRAGIPLMELVTEPEIKSAQEAGDFARELQLLLRYLGVADANMEKGEMRVEANISVQSTENSKQKILGTKVEIKNLNSFRAMERAVAHEIKRQEQLLRDGKKVTQETRGWDEAKQATFTQRSKEGSADYRYFPDPDLPSLRISESSDFSSEALMKGMPELPWERRARYVKMGIKQEDADLLTSETSLGAYFDEVQKSLPSGVAIQSAANYVTNDLVKLIRDVQGRDSGYSPEVPVSARNLTKILEMVAEKRISSRVAKDLLYECAKDGSDPEALAVERGLLRVEGGEELSVVVEAILKAHAGVVEDYHRGKESALEYLVGQGMKATRGAADPENLRRIIRTKIR
ncbi:glutaminyl-tRNA synthase (glutamine-hydrolyzing) subunit B [Candidatus Kaiserbacteria bacterium RIFCSPLOWO2_01_FULL_54_13]|uniref:Aspartyl/glutamyl-tRNA(Asn/Gln) amidotransferase subunit B n=1 Tax=Candidatus Kaiserbacteria bacterium RIFCSPLOWO2_01_FULL_54_13 TaxID=1798512 RepID=A0A1F6F2H9_9BACT|nr:MAG: glutaminyl-tRNA synthase (glutamine-hydrolyzing) subunit B [Candidatus Kaiserbacteria bacterium RIFCSPLOWO2_01_FULL_54_13]